MTLLADQKFSTFQVGGNPTTGDIIVGLRGGINTQFSWAFPALVSSITGTADEVLVNGTSGSPITGSVTLTTPQPIAPTSSPTFNVITATTSVISPLMLPGNLSLSGNTIASTNSNGNINIIPNGSGATQGIILFGSPTTVGTDTTSLIQATSVNRGGAISIMTNWNANAGAGLYLSTSRSAVPGTLSPVTSSQILSQIVSRGDDGVTGLTVASIIESDVDGSVSSGVVPGKILFSTANSSGVITLGMSLDSSQNLTLVNPLLIPSGGTGKSSFTAYSVICGGTTSTGALQNVSGVGTANQVLVSNGAGALPSWQSVPGLTPAALTKTDDTNVTLTLGGTPATALLQATSLTLGWTGQLGVTRGGTGISSFGTGVATALGQNVNGSGAISLTTSPTFVTPVLGAAAATSINFGGSSLSNYVTGGTFTPSVSIGGSTTGITYSTQSGNYTVIGNVLTFQITLFLTSTGGLVGTVSIDNLPSAAIGGYNTFAIYMTNMTLTGSPSCYMPGGTTSIQPGQNTTGTFSNISNVQMTNTTQFLVTGSYLI